MAILDASGQPQQSDDPETLGLSGAFDKRLFELTSDRAYLDQAIRSCERGFGVKRNHCSGINVACRYGLRANLQAPRARDATGQRRRQTRHHRRCGHRAGPPGPTDRGHLQDRLLVTRCPPGTARGGEAQAACA
jgi:hypothetical protein